MPQPNQIDRQRDDVHATALNCWPARGADHRAGSAHEHQRRHAIHRVWLGGNGCVPLYNLMEDAATAEISRAQVWQWIHHPRGVLDDGRKVTVELYRQCWRKRWTRFAGKGAMRFEPEISSRQQNLRSLSKSDELVDLLTLPAYGRLQ